MKKGEKVGHTTKRGYIITRLGTKHYKIHRIIFAIHHGYFPLLVDHIDRNPKNNKIENLREATYSENSINTGLRKNNASGYKGVYFHKQRQKWASKIQRMNKKKWIGLFDTPEEAHQARVEFIERELNEKHLQ